MAATLRFPIFLLCKGSWAFAVCIFICQPVTGTEIAPKRICSTRHNHPTSPPPPPSLPPLGAFKKLGGGQVVEGTQNVILKLFGCNKYRTLPHTEFSLLIRGYQTLTFSIPVYVAVLSLHFISFFGGKHIIAYFLGGERPISGKEMLA